MLTPAEIVGLSGATLETRVRQAARHVTDTTFARIAQRLTDAVREQDGTYEHDGVVEPVRVMLRPLLVMPEQLSYVHHVCARITDALKRLPQLYFDDPDVRSVLAISASEEAWLRDAWMPEHAGVTPIYGRLDAVCNFASAGWRESLQFMEANLSGVGGIHYGPLAETTVLREVVPTLCAHDPDLEIELPRDQRELFLQLLLDHARAVGRPRPNLCFIEPKYDAGGSNEQPALMRYLSGKHDGSIVHADPRELRVVGDEVYFEDTRVDIAYRDYETRDLIALGARHGHDLAAVRLLFRQNRIVSSVGGDFDHKSCWELLTDPELAARHFTGEERRLFDRHVLWTRVLSARRTSLPRGEGDLPEFARTHREDLVIKPNRGYGGTGIHIGRLTAQDEWEALIDRALAAGSNGSAPALRGGAASGSSGSAPALRGGAASDGDDAQRWVVQSLTQLPVYEFPVVDDAGRVHEEPFYAVMGFAPTDGGLGMLCRVSQKQVVNVAQRGGLAALLIGYSPAELRAPVRATARRQVAIDKLRGQISDLRGLDAAIAVLGWDEETYLPDGARSGRGEQLGVLESLRHRLLSTDELGDLIEEVSAQTEPRSLLEAELARLRQLRRVALALPDDLVRSFAQVRSQTLARWELARERDDFATFAPAFVRLVGLVRERAQALQRGESLYDGLLDEHEPGMTRARLDPILQALSARLLPLSQELAERTARVSGRLPGGHYDDAVQDRMCRDLLAAIGFDFDRGRIDRSTHPFTLSAGENDVRVTVRSSEDDPLVALFATLHEGGHALYDQGFDPTLYGTLLAEGPGMGIHESQSRLWENQVGRSRAFWEHHFPKLRAEFPDQLGRVDAERAYRSVNAVRPGLNRVEADEVTYNLHIALRYELELGLVDGNLGVEDLEVAWSDASERLLGVRPSSALEGCLQDVHWAIGAFGYFPTYALGNLYGAQLMEAFVEQRPGWSDELARGDSSALLSWLRERIHRHGNRYSADELLTNATGRPLDVEPFFRLLAAKHGAL